MRIHVTGASGSGVTTLGSGLAHALRLRHLDIDDFYWLPSEIPLTERREPQECVLRVAEAQGGGKWVLSGSLMGWGEPLVADADLIVFVTAPTVLRLDRLKVRERQRYGAHIAPGGALHSRHEAFIAWAGRYDDAAFRGRSRASHEDWIAARGRPVLRVDGGLAADAVLAEALSAIRGSRAA